ncbi:hypothetical protein H6G80_35870 [Nostoc sp. FACHB-87]|uniref:hypothetical protein n=1 Tax=Nostocaceae TaxID=1162 RepID=UPI001689C412|nr:MULTISPECIES: hypothetical protein [Nostocaceae]MBD2303834.1 hypothetical protein [Nostoc sp. FACHB-190]MBD2459389.1 hypothetical protein [Nostoc sp. FACHB-87]MBD2480375.1 hypothetical protein [Anabaena sp. FACHB-83]
MPKLTCLTAQLTVLTALTLTSCSTTSVEQYEATALTSYIWQVKYANNLTNAPQPRIESFGTASVLNRNGLKPAGAVIGPDDQGLWWPIVPLRPSIDEVEQRKKPQEEAGKPELQKTVKYQITYGAGEQQKTLPTNYDVYRQVVKAYPSRTPLELTFGLNDDSVEKAEPVGK